jgi:hypothetical protein
MVLNRHAFFLLARVSTRRAAPPSNQFQPRLFGTHSPNNLHFAFCIFILLFCILAILHSAFVRVLPTPRRGRGADFLHARREQTLSAVLVRTTMRTPGTRPRAANATADSRQRRFGYGTLRDKLPGRKTTNTTPTTDETDDAKSPPRELPAEKANAS